MKKHLILLLLIFTSFIFAKEVEVIILGTSDVHGRIEPWNYSTDTEDMSGSFSQISTIVNQYRKDNKNIILVDAGDIIQDNLIEKFIDEPKHPAMEVMNKMKYDIIVPGNHEFNFGMDKLDNVVKGFKGKVLVSNIFYKTGERYLSPTTIIKKEGIKIGFIGTSTPMTEKFEEDTGNVKDMRFEMPVEEIRKQVRELKRQKVDAIILVAHMGLDNENNIPDTGVRDIINKVDGIDIVVAGHMHQNVSKEVVKDTLVTEPGRYGANVSVVTLKFDTDRIKKLTSKDTKTIDVKGIESDDSVAKLYTKYSNIIREDANTVIGITERSLVPQEMIKGIPAVYMRDTGLTSLFAEMQIYYGKADVTSILIDNRKAILDKGEIKKKDVANNYQYTGGEISIYEITGKDLKDYMEWSAAYFDSVKAGDTEYRFDKVRGASKYMTYDMFGGVTYKIDLREEPGNRIKNLTLVNGTKVTDTTKVKIGMNGYRYEMLVKAGGPLEGRRVSPIWNSKEEYGEEAGTIRNLLIKYIKEVKNGKVSGESKDNWEVIGL